jgi:prepilin-type N-terminal cleavage/methylation domain-containing protein
MKSQNPIPASCQASSGFTLIEVLISLVVILFSFMAALMVLTSSHRSGSLAESQTLAVFLAEAKLEELRHMTPASLVSDGQLEEFFDRHGGQASADDHFFSRAVTLRAKTPSQFTHEVTVQVKWPNSRPVSYRSVIPAT